MFDETDDHVTSMGDEKRALLGRHVRTKTLGRPRPKWEHNIKIDPEGVEWGGGGGRLD